MIFLFYFCVFVFFCNLTSFFDNLSEYCELVSFCKETKINLTKQNFLIYKE